MANYEGKQKNASEKSACCITLNNSGSVEKIKVGPWVISKPNTNIVGTTELEDARQLQLSIAALKK